MANTLTKMFGRTIIHADTDDGAITLTLILGAYSAAKDFAKPSIAPYAVATLEWNGIP